MNIPTPVYLQNEAKERLRSLITERYPNKSKKERIILGYRFRRLYPNSCVA